MRTIDLFSGCGGLSLGLKMAGLDIVASYENWKAASEIYRQNFEHPVFEIDLSDTEQAINHINQFKPQMIVGGPPCQDFSSAGKRNENGTKSDLTLSFTQIVIDIMPKWFLMENVERIQKTTIFSKIKKIFKDSGYGLTEIVLDASKYGVPQRRKRMFLVGNIGSSNDFLFMKLLKGQSNKSLTVRDYLGKDLGIDYYYRHARSYARRGIFSIDEPSPTIRGVNRPIPPGYVLHPGDSTTNLEIVRPLTSIERSYIQTFPKNFNWEGVSKTALEQMIGNAVPVNLAKHVGSCILEFNDYQNNLKTHFSMKMQEI